MKVLNIFALALLFAACTENPYRTHSSTETPDARLDNISRNLGETQGGSIRDPSTLSPPPIRRGFVNER